MKQCLYFRIFPRIETVLAVFVLILIVAFAFTLNASAQTKTDTSPCTDGKAIYQDSRLVYSCKIETISGTPVVVESDGSGKETQRPITTDELNNWNADVLQKFCDSRIASSRQLLATPVSSGTVQELRLRLAAVENLVNADGKCS